MLHSELIVNAYHSLTTALLTGFPVLAVLVTVLYFFKIRGITRRKRSIIKGLRELTGSRDIDKHLPYTEIVTKAETELQKLKGQASIDPKLLLALDYKLKKYNRLVQDKRGFLAYLLVFIFLTVFMGTLSTVALFISPWLAPGQRVTVMVLEFIPSLVGFAFLTYIVVKMLGWPDKDESGQKKSPETEKESQPDS